MSDYDNTNTIQIFKNDTKEGEQPDYRGKVNVDGVEKEISLWIRTAKTTGRKYMSGTVQEPWNKDNKPQNKQGKKPSFDDDIPF